MTSVANQAAIVIENAELMVKTKVISLRVREVEVAIGNGRP